MEATKEGFYRVSYTNEDGLSGMGILCLDTGIIVGCGIGGDLWNGNYKYNSGKDTLEGKLKVTFPQGPLSRSTLTGVSYGLEGGSEEIFISFPRNFSEVTFLMGFPGLKNLNIRIQKIRDFPN